MVQKYWPLFLLIGVGLLAILMLNQGGGGNQRHEPFTELGIEDVKVGEGEEAKAGDSVQVHYTGKLAESGHQFDSSVGKTPFEFNLGRAQVIRGWDKGVAGMKVGGKRILKIPAEMGYGKRGAGRDIPPNADLVFEVELLRVGKSELGIEDVVVGEGPGAKTGDAVQVHYTGKLADSGLQFDSSVGKAPFVFTLGKGEVIPGWDRGVVGMKVGGKRILKIPSALAYGSNGAGDAIPPNANLVFEVELLKISAPGSSR